HCRLVMNLMTLLSSLIPPPSRSPLFPYTTLFRSQRAEHRDRILQRIGQHDGEAITLPEPLLLQPRGEGPRELIEPPVGELRAHLDEGDALGVLCTGLLQQLLQRAQLRGVDFRGHV